MGETETATVSGSHCPSPFSGFADLSVKLGCKRKLLENVAAMRFEEPTCVQRHAIPCILAKRDLFVIAPTGSGKTLAFLLPGAQLSREQMRMCLPEHVCSLCIRAAAVHAHRMN